jgi:hypothetical protein
MAFLIYKKTNAGQISVTNGSETAEAQRARRIDCPPCDSDAARTNAKAGNWTPPDCSSSPGARENLGVLFDAAGHDANAVCFYELTRLHGSCRDTRTNLALDFNIVLDRNSTCSGGTETGFGFVLSTRSACLIFLALTLLIRPA